MFANKHYILFGMFLTSIFMFSFGFNDATAYQSELTLVSLATIHNSSTGLSLHGFNVETLTISNNTYAFVLDSKNNIQIINITNPAVPISVSILQNIINNNKIVTSIDTIVTDKRSYIVLFIKNEKHPLFGSFKSPIIIDVTNPVKPKEIRIKYLPQLEYINQDPYGKIFEINNTSLAVIMTGNQGGGIRIFDFTVPQKPTMISDWFYIEKPYHDFNRVVDINLVSISDQIFAFPHNRFSVISVDNPTIFAVPNWRIQNSSDYITINDLAIVEYLNNTYAIVFSKGSIHTIDVSTPIRPLLISSIYKNSEEFGSLTQFGGTVETFSISDKTFAIIPTGKHKDENRNIQIIDITNPILIRPAGTIPYEYVSNIAIFESNDDIYALISGREYSQEGWDYINVMKIINTPVSDYTMSITDLKMVDMNGNKTYASVGNQVHFTANLLNNHYKEQDFIFFIQVSDNDGNILNTSWTSGSIKFGKSIGLSSGFTPYESGSYSATAFAWISLNDKTSLTDIARLNFIVE